MALKISTGVRNSLLGKKDSITAGTISFAADGSVISDSGSGLLSAGFRPGDVIEISGAGTAGNNQITKVVSVAAGGGSMVVEGTLVDEAASESVTIETVGGKSVADMFRNHVLMVYSGSAPATADDAETGTKLLELTVESGAVVAGTAENGLDFDETDIASGLLKNAADVISGVGLVTGTAGYYRMYDNGKETGASTVAKRIQGTVGTTNANLIMTSTSVVKDATTTISSHQIAMPAS